MSKLITVPNPLTDNTYIWQTKEEANAFFGSFSVASATESAEGVVKKAANVTFTYSAPIQTYITFPGIAGDGSQVNYQVPSWAYAQALEAVVQANGSAIDNILTALKAAGIMSNS